LRFISSSPLLDSTVLPYRPDAGILSGRITYSTVDVKKVVGYTHLLVIGAGSLFCGALGLAFITLAVYLAYNSISGGQQFRLRPLMMPMMNILISSVLFFYCRRLFAITVTVQRALSSNSYTPPRIKATNYDIIAIVVFLAFVALVTIFLM